jgi:hypothetical protein
MTLSAMLSDSRKETLQKEINQICLSLIQTIEKDDSHCSSVRFLGILGTR